MKINISKMSFCIALLISACTTTTPNNINNICKVFKEKKDWYAEAKESSEKWGIPIHVNMAIMYQESQFVADAKPPRQWLLGIIPWFRPSSAYGYAQAIDATWEDYLDHKESHWSADRDDFYDASDFIGWYCSLSHQTLGISKWDTHKLYLAYHEGHTGYKRKNWLKKPWLIRTAKKVSNKSSRFHKQLSKCKEDLESANNFFW
jgi:hypothetical protein